MEESACPVYFRDLGCNLPALPPELTEIETFRGRDVIGEGTTLRVQATSNLQVNWQT
jgi:hypothetical protein